jgi:cell division protein FtsN
MKTNQLVALVVSAFTTQTALANYEVEKLLDAYVVAKAESQQTQLTDEEIKKAPYTIQVASYINEKDAVSHVDELKGKDKDFEVQYFPSFVRGQVWFKVCVGKFESKEKAEEYRKKFIKKHDEPFAVVVSRLDRPDSKKRVPANVAQRESSPVPVNSQVSSNEDKKNLPQIKLIPKAVKPDIKSENTMAVKHDDFYSIQIGAYPTEELAKENLSSMKSKGADLYYKIAYVNGKKWYRLFMGKFKSKKDAEAYHKELTREKADSFIRRVTASE